MDPVILPEPAIYIYAGDENGSFASQHFATYWSSFKHFRDFVEFNGLRFACTPDLQAASRNMFPWTDLPPNARHERSAVQDLATQVVRFLANYAANTEYADVADKTLIEGELLRNDLVYLNTDVWLAWRDLLGQIGMQLAAIRKAGDDLLACDCGRSCIPNDCLVVEILAGVSHKPTRLSLRVCRIAAGQWPCGTIDPKPFRDMCKRKSSGEVDIDWEDTGHQPPAIMERVLVRTAREASGIVRRMNTKRWIRSAAVCKLEPASDCCQLQFRISEGDGTLIGLFTTAAENDAEQKAAHAYVDQIFRRQCESAGLHYAGT